MLTRATVITRNFALELCYKFKGSDQFPAVLLPSKRDVLQRLMHEENWRSKDAVQIVSKEVFKV